MQAMGAARHVACYQRWIAGQEAGLGELEASSANAATGRATDGELRAVVERCMRGYAEYVSTRRALAREDGAALFAPPWCTSFENSVLWIGGCRPSLTIRLLYSLEDALSDRLATLQEDVADRPLLPIVRERATAAAAALGAGASCDGLATRTRLVVATPEGAVDHEVDAAIGRYKAGLGRLLEEADELRMSTAQTLVTEILTPRQAVETLVAAKQLGADVGRRRSRSPRGRRSPCRRPPLQTRDRLANSPHYLPS
jgi:hypothetical protein